MQLLTLSDAKKNQVDESVFETSQEKELWSIYTSIKDRIHSGNSTSFSNTGMVQSYKLKFLSLLPILFQGIGIEEFTEISTQLVEPLEDFFNNVFVMVVS